MAKNKRDISRWKIRIARLLHPVPVFFIVTTLTALVYTVPNLRQTYQTSTTSLFGITTFVFNILLPVATGFIAAFGVFFGLSDLRRKTDDSDRSRNTKESYTSEDRSRAIARHLPTAAITMDVNGKVTFLNPAAADLFHIYQPEDHYIIDQFIDSNGLRGSLEEVFKGNTITVDRTGILLDDPETERTWEITGIPFTRNEEVVEAFLLIENRAQYRLLEDELIRTEDRYKNIFNHAPCSIFFVDSQGYYLDANPAALEMLGYSLEELITLTTRELSSDSDRRHRRLREAPGWIEDETRYLRKDGKVVEAELQGSSFQSGTETYFIGIAKDVTARNELQRNLSAAKARLKAVLSLETRPLILLDAQDRIANVNSSAIDLLDCPSEKLLGIPLKDLIDGDPPPLQESSSASSSPCIFDIPQGPSINLSVIRLPLGSATNTGSLLLLSAGPLPVISSKS